jgi:outer membrane protein OmpA-like peptidoglycan-associated protein
MNNFSEIDTETSEEDSGIYLSISDLMSSLMMIFVLLFITVQVQLQTYKQAIDELPIRILDALDGKIGGKGLYAVDPETGDVSIGDRILFDEGSAELKPEGKQFLAKFIPTYSNVIFSDSLFDRQITRIVIEGHTSSKGSDRDNMELSLRRALSVSDYILSNQLNFATKEHFKQKILASGRGEIDANQTINKPGDRRVVFRFQFRREDFKQFFQRQDTANKSLEKR